jgi:membrane protein implicated in regulation of membrane protease activity
MFLLVALVLLLVLPGPWNAFAAGAGLALFGLEVLHWYRRMRGHGVQTGVEQLVGSVGEVVEPLMPVGRIRVLGELWEARAPTELPRGTPVRVLKVDGLTLEVQSARAASANGAAPAGTSRTT